MKTTCQQHPIGSHAARFKEQLLRQQSRGGFTLTELFVVIAIVAMLAATLLPALAASKDRSKRAECASNLRQICVATSVYAADRNDYLPPLKWRDSNSTYPYEMFRYSPVNVTPPTYDFSGGPYNLGTLWQNNILVDGKVYYCPADLNNDQFTYAYYSVKTNWPWGVDTAVAVSNPGYVRAGYTYYPQSRKTQKLTITGLGIKSVPFWPDYSASPDPNKSWICVPPFKQTEIDQTKSMVVDLLFSSDHFSHKSKNTVLGLNAGFGDGHVAWQGVNQNPAAFDPNLWEAITIGGGSTAAGQALKYVESLWQP